MLGSESEAWGRDGCLVLSQRVGDDKDLSAKLEAWERDGCLVKSRKAWCCVKGLVPSWRLGDKMEDWGRDGGLGKDGDLVLSWRLGAELEGRLAEEKVGLVWVHREETQHH